MTEYEAHEVGRYIADAGQVGGDEQLSIAPSRRFAQKHSDGTYTVITEYAYVVEFGSETDPPYQVLNLTETIECTDVDNAGSTEITSNYDFDYPSAFAFKTKAEAISYARKYIRSLDVSMYNWTAVNR